MTRVSAIAGTWRLGLIGGNILSSRSPVLHTVCALSVGGNASYDLIVPAERGMDFVQLLDHCAGAGFTGVNVTYPHKQDAAAHVPAGDPLVKAMGSANTIRFTPAGPVAYNTDSTGFHAAFRARFGAMAPGRVLVIGAGGVGRAVSFALASLGAGEILLHDSIRDRELALAGDLTAQFPDAAVRSAGPERLADLGGLDGVVNCTPLGMTGRPGSPLARGAAGAPAWAFDAVYTPDRTPFRAQTEALGAEFLPGSDLYFHQGVQAFEIFTGLRPDLDWVRRVLAYPGSGPAP